MWRIAIVATVLMLSAAEVRADGVITTPSAPEGSEPERTTADPGWWQRTFVGWDANGDGRYMGGERGVLLIAWDAVMTLFKSIGEFMLRLVWAAIPAEWKPNTDSMSAYVKIANTWLPLDFMLGLFFAYYAFISVFVTFRWALKFVPFLG